MILKNYSLLHGIIKDQSKDFHIFVTLEGDIKRISLLRDLKKDIKRHTLF